MKYRLINKNVIPRPFRSAVLRYNTPVIIEAELSEDELNTLKASGVICEKIAPRAIAKKEPKKKSAKKQKKTEAKVDTPEPHKENVKPDDEG